MEKMMLAERLEARQQQIEQMEKIILTLRMKNKSSMRAISGLRTSDGTNGAVEELASLDRELESKLAKMALTPEMTAKMQELRECKEELKRMKNIYPVQEDTEVHHQLKEQIMKYELTIKELLLRQAKSAFPGKPRPPGVEGRQARRAGGWEGRGWRKCFCASDQAQCCAQHRIPDLHPTPAHGSPTRRITAAKVS
jgi:hypothetical protein